MNPLVRDYKDCVEQTSTFGLRTSLVGHRVLFVSCSDIVVLLGTAGTQCVGTWLVESTIPLIILNSSNCLRMYKRWNK